MLVLLPDKVITAGEQAALELDESFYCVRRVGDDLETAFCYFDEGDLVVEYGWGAVRYHLSKGPTTAEILEGCKVRIEAKNYRCILSVM